MNDKDNLPILGMDDSSDREKKEQKAQELWQMEKGKQSTEPEPQEEEIPSIGERRSRRIDETDNVEIPSITERGKKNDPTSSGLRSKHVSSCEELQKKNTTFVFVYGASQSGKSCFLVSLLNHMSKDTGARLEPSNLEENRTDHILLEEMIGMIEDGVLPKPTQAKTVYELGFSYTPTIPKIPAKFTFLEMSGENIEQVHLSKTTYGKLPAFVDRYLDCPTINICFIMVVPFDAGDKGEVSWAKIDGNALSFLNYIKEKNENFDAAKLLLLVSKWDKYEGEYKGSPLRFVEKKMGRTYAQLHAKRSMIGSYSIGDVKKWKDEEGKIVELIETDTIDKTSPDKVKNWLYEAVTGRPIGNNSDPWWSSLFNWFK